MSVISLSCSTIEKSDMFRWLGKNFGTFLLALLLGIAVWVAAVNESDPDEVLTYPTPITLEIVGQDTNLVITNAYSKQIELTLRAPRSVWEELVVNKDGIHAILDLSGYGVGEHTVVPQIQVGIQPVKVISFAPTAVTLNLEELVTTTFPVKLSLIGKPSIGYQAGSVSYTPEEITISGPKSQVARVKTVLAEFDLSNVRESIDESLSVRALDEFNGEVDGVSLSPDLTRLVIPISQQGGYRDVAVKVVINGQVASLYRLTDISVFPPVVTLYSSDSALISELPGVVETEPLDISGISADISARLKLILPENILIVGDQTVLVNASVEAILGSLTISDKTLEIINLDPNLSAVLSSLTVDVIVSGPLPVLDALSLNDLRVFVDLAGLGIGTHQLTPSFEILNDAVQIQSLLPESIEVILSEALLATPTPLP